MNALAKVLDKRQRLALFLDQLNERKCTFRKSVDAYNHISDTLDAVEVSCEISDFRDMLLMIPYGDFVVYKKVKLRTWEARSHIVILHENGSYAVYDLKPYASLEDAVKVIPVDVEYYKAANALVLFPNADGMRIW
jgi:hypothetical protein